MKPFIAQRLRGKDVLTHPRIGPPPLDRALAVDCMHKVKQMFDDADIPFWLAGGTMLGAVRDGDFIPWDTDIDLGVYERDAERIFPLISEMEDYGLKVIRTNKIDNTFQVKKELVCIEFATAAPYRTDMWRWWRFYEPFDVFSEFIDCEFIGKIYRIPLHHERYCQIHYGETWRIPNSSIKHAKLFRIPRRHLFQNR